MSLRLPSVLPKEESISSKPAAYVAGNYGVPDAIVYGLGAARQQVLPKHPLEATEKKFANNQASFDFGMLKSVQGIHAPLRLTMERQAASKIGRLPFLSSSNLMLDTLTGKDDTIGFEDVLNMPQNSEVSVDPHLAMERSLGFI